MRSSAARRPRQGAVLLVVVVPPPPPRPRRRPPPLLLLLKYDRSSLIVEHGENLAKNISILCPIPSPTHPPVNKHRSGGRSDLVVVVLVLVCFNSHCSFQIISFYLRYMYILLVIVSGYIYEVERGAYCMLSWCLLFPTHSTRSPSIGLTTGFSTTHFSHHTNKSIRRLPIIINLLTFVFYHHYVA